MGRSVAALEDGDLAQRVAHAVQHGVLVHLAVQDADARLVRRVGLRPLADGAVAHATQRVVEAMGAAHVQLRWQKIGVVGTRGFF